MATSTANADSPVVEHRTDDWALLRRYVDFSSQEAFSELVARHLSWVHATCRKALRDQQMAEDAAQAVFMILARRAASITEQTRLSGWLFNTARFVVKDARKQQARYRRREDVARELAAERMAPRRPPVAADTQAALDDALATLTERDRQALLMHFYEGLSLNEMADVLEIGKEGVKKRVARALGRLRKRLGSKRAPVAPLLALVVLLRSRAASALPMGLNHTVVSAATTPGHASILAEWMARQGMRAAAGASGRLLRAALAAELVAAVTVVGIWSTPKATRPTATPAGQVAVVAPTSKPPITVSNASSPAPAPQPNKPFVTTTSNEPAYRSGADDPQPKPSPLPRGETSGGGAPVAATVAPTVAGPARETASNTIYAGVAPVQRSFATGAPPPPAPVEVRRALPAAAPISVGGRSAAVAIASARPARAQEASTPPPTPSSLPAASPSSSPSVTPSAEHIVSQCLALLSHPDERARDEIDGWFAGHQKPPAHPGQSGSGKPVEVAFNDHGPGNVHGHIRRMFIEDGDHPTFHRRNDRSDHHGLKPYLAVADDDDDDHHTLTGHCPHTAEVEGLATTGDFPGRPLWHPQGNDGLCAPTLPATVQPAASAALSAPPDFAPSAFQAVPEPGITGITSVLLSAALLRRRRDRR